MTQYILTYGKDQKFGNMGFRLEGTSLNSDQYNMASKGLMIAHDILEHINGLKEIGGIGDELEALGVVWYIRGEFHDLNRGKPSYYTPYESLASDIVEMGRKIIAYDSGYHMPVPNVNIKNHSELDSFLAIIKYAKKNLIAELEGEPYTTKELHVYLANALKYMISGYNKAVKKYRYIGQIQVNNVFWNIANTVDDILKHCNYEGQQFILHVNKTKNIVTWDNYYQEELYYA